MVLLQTGSPDSVSENLTAIFISAITKTCQRGYPGYDRLGKGRKIMEKLQERFLTINQPHCELAMDEAMIPYQGRSSLKQYIPKTTIKRGIKVWCHADSHNGYICEL